MDLLNCNSGNVETSSCSNVLDSVNDHTVRAKANWWTEEEDNILYSLLKDKNGRINWKEEKINAALGSVTGKARTIASVKARWAILKKSRGLLCERSGFQERGRPKQDLGQGESSFEITPSIEPEKKMSQDPKGGSIPEGKQVRQDSTRDLRHWTQAKDQTLVQLCASPKIQWKRERIVDRLQEKTGKLRSQQAIRDRWKILREMGI